MLGHSNIKDKEHYEKWKGFNFDGTRACVGDWIIFEIGDDDQREHIAAMVKLRNASESEALKDISLYHNDDEKEWIKAATIQNIKQEEDFELFRVDRWQKDAKLIKLVMDQNHGGDSNMFY